MLEGVRVIKGCHFEYHMATAVYIMDVFNRRETSLQPTPKMWVVTLKQFRWR